LAKKLTIPQDIVIGKNCALYGKLTAESFEDGQLASGCNIIIEEAGE